MRVIIIVFVLLASFFALKSVNAQQMGVSRLKNSNNSQKEIQTLDKGFPAPPPGSVLPGGPDSPEIKPEELTLPKADFTILQEIPADTVKEIIDPLTIRLEREGLARIGSLDIPDLTPYAQGPIAESAMAILKHMLEGKRVRVFQTQDKIKGRKNRLNQLMVHLSLEGSDSWVQGILVRLGLARVRTDPSNTELTRELYALEEMARAEKLGLWAFPEYRILKAEETADKINSFQIVEGRVVSAARKQNNIYLNFGNDWREDFTVGIASSDAKTFFKANMNPQDLNNKTIRVRGWLRSYNGAYMEIDHPERVEILEK